MSNVPVVRCLTIGIVMAALIATSAIAYPERDQFVTFLDYSKASSEPTYDKVESGLSTIPKDVRQALADSGYTVTIAPTMLSAVPTQQGGVPRGWSEDSNYDNVGGLFEGHLKRIVIPEKLQSRKNPNSYLPNERAELTIRHEVGHAYDHFQGFVSRTDGFVDAYTADADKIPVRDQDQYSYFLQPNGAGNSELFADLFAAAYTPDADSNNRYRDLLKAFPRTAQLVMKLSPHRPVSAKKKTADTEKTEKTEKPNDSSPSGQGRTFDGYEGRAQLVQMQRQISALYAQRKFAEAEPITREYVRLMEHASTGTKELQQTYLSYANLLQSLGKADEAKAIRAKAQSPGHVAVTQEYVPAKQKASGAAMASANPLGIVGLKFVLTPGQSPIINRVFAGTPAAQGGLHTDDAIVDIDGSPTLGLSKEEIYELIAGPPGTTVELGIMRRDKHLSMTLKRISISSLSDPVVKRDYLMNR